MARRSYPSLTSIRLVLEALEERLTPTISVQLDYRFDLSGFFNNQSRRDLLQLAVSTLASRLNDTLSPIVPSGLNTWSATFADPTTGLPLTLPNLAVPANTVVVFVGARVLSGGAELGQGGPGGFAATGTQDWINTVTARGQAGALTSSASQTDFGPWGGSLAFDAGANWYFGQDPSGLTSNADDFLSVAEHEFSHLLGFGTAASWSNHVSGTQFTGPAAEAQFGGPVSVDASGAQAAHWQNNTLDHGTAGFPRACMDPSLPVGTRAAFTPLDFAGLEDIGWQVQNVRGQVKGTVFDDADDNGAQSSGDSGVGGRTIFADLNNNGLIDPGEPTAQTAADGTYVVMLQPSSSNYTVRLQPQNSESLTAPAGGVYVLSVTANAVLSSKDFGIHVANSGQVTGSVYWDANDNGVIDSGENPLGGRIVFADTNRNGILDANEPSAVTAADGSYTLLLSQQAAPYQLELAAGGGDLISLPAANAYQVTLAAGATLSGRNFGIVLTSVAVPIRLEPSNPFVSQGNANSDYVQALYRSILHRNGTPSEYTPWVNQLNANASARATVVQTLWNSAEHRGLEVDDLYASILHRAADAAGRSYWVGQLQQGTAEEAIAIQFLESPEFLQHGDAFFVDFLYRSVLGRTSDASGEAYWVNSLANKTLTHDQVVRSFLYAPESLTRLVDGYFSVFLNRPVDPAGQSYWVGQLQNGLPFSNIGIQFLETDEFFARGGR